MTQQQPRILLCWGYHRAGWIQPFERLKDRFQFTYLFYRNAEEERLRLTAEPVIYWDDHQDAHEILDALRPGKVIFMSLTSGYSIALNMAARHRGIPTYILQHGIFQTYADYRASERISASQVSKRIKVRGAAPSAKSSSLGFLRRSLRMRDLPALPLMTLYFILKKLKGHTVASRYARFPQRMPSGYICFTERNSTIHREVDRARDEDIQIIGVPEYDKFFECEPASSTEETAESPYYLLIDQPLAENSWGTPLVSVADMICFYRKLNEYCKQRGARLRVKLHPESYGSEWLPKDENIEWLEDTDTITLIRGAEACFGMFSSLLLPAAVHKPLCLFKVQPSSMVEDLSQRGLAVVKDFLDFQPEDIEFPNAAPSSEDAASFQKDYFFKTDGGAVARLEKALSQ